MIKNLLTVTVAVLLSSPAAFALTGKQIMLKSDDLPMPKTTRSIAEMKIYKGGEVVERKIKLKAIQLGKNQKISAEIVSPFNMKVLTHTNRKQGDQQWLKQENGKVKKIISGDRRKPFANSHIFYEDLKSRDIDDYTYKLLGSEKVEGHDCYQVEATPKKGKSVYDKAIFFVIKSGNFAYFVIRADIFYKGYLYKRLVNYEIKKKSGIITPYKAVMYRLNKKGKKLGRTEMVIEKIQFNSPKIVESMFNKSRL